MIFFFLFDFEVRKANVAQASTVTYLFPSIDFTVVSELMWSLQKMTDGKRNLHWCGVVNRFMLQWTCDDILSMISIQVEFLACVHKELLQHCPCYLLAALRVQPDHEQHDYLLIITIKAATHKDVLSGLTVSLHLSSPPCREVVCLLGTPSPLPFLPCTPAPTTPFLNPSYPPSSVPHPMST